MSREGEIIAGYEVESVLGYGANSTIYAVKDPKSSEKFAMKRVVRKDQGDQRFIDQMANEYHCARQIDSPFVRKCYHLKKKKAMFTVKEAYLVMEFVAGENLIQRKPDELLAQLAIFLKVCDGLMAIAEAGYVHGDMKPHNILVDVNGDVKLIDMGQSCTSGTVKNRIQGTPDFIAPEQVKRRPLTAQTDMFNLGATMYHTMTDRHIPTMIPDENERRSGERPFFLPSHYNKQIPKPLDDFIIRCLEQKPIDRHESWEKARSTLELITHKIKRDLQAGQEGS